MMRMLSQWNRLVTLVSGRIGEGVALLAARAGLAVVFWNSGRTKVEEGTWLQVSDTTRFLFAEEYSGVPLPPELAATLATWGEFILPVLLLLGLGTRLSAAGLLGMTAVIQLFVYPESWTVHLLWAGLALVLVSRGGGLFALDTLLLRSSPAFGPGPRTHHPGKA